MPFSADLSDMHLAEAASLVEALILLHEEVAAEQPARVRLLTIPALYCVCDKLRAARGAHLFTTIDLKGEAA